MTVNKHRPGRASLSTAFAKISKMKLEADYHGCCVDENITSMEALKITFVGQKGV